MRWRKTTEKSGAGRTASSEITYTVEKIAGYYVRSSASIQKGVYTRVIQTLASLEEGTSLPKLLQAFEKEAVSSGAKQIVLEGVDIVEKRLINAETAQRLGYTFEQTGNNSIRLVKKL